MKQASTGWPRRNNMGSRIKVTVSPLRGTHIRVNEKTGERTRHHNPADEWQVRRDNHRATACVLGYLVKRAKIMDDKGTHRNIGCPPEVISTFPELAYTDAPWIKRLTGEPQPE